MHRIFLSYAREDSEEALRLFTVLNGAASVDVWFDQESLLPGQSWSREIRKAIGQADFFVLLLSRISTSKRGFYQREIREALDEVSQRPEGEIFLIPVRLEDCDPHFEGLQSIQYVDLFPDWDAGVAKILKAVRTHLPRQEGSSELREACSLRFTSHRASFDGDHVRCYFLTVANLSSGPIEVTHLWFETPESHIAIEPASRPLPKVLIPSESWQSWVAVRDLPSYAQASAYESFWVRLSSGQVASSIKEDSVPRRGSVPGGPVLEKDLAKLKPT